MKADTPPPQADEAGDATRPPCGRYHPLLVVTCGVLLSVFLGLRVRSLVQTLPDVRMQSDSAVFLDMASKPILSRAFLAGQRPFTVPLMYKCVGGRAQAIALLQSLLSAVAWSLLAVQVARSLRRPWVKGAGFGLILAIGLTGTVVGWDTVIMSESISLSLMILFLAAWIGLIQSWHWGKGLAVVLIGFLWAFSRETNAYVILMIAAVLFGVALVQPSCRRYLWIAALFAAFFAANQVSSDLGRRWEFPYLNVLAQRILPSEPATRYFRNAGMPVTPQLEAMAYRWASSDHNAFNNDPNLGGFRQWLRVRGRFTYLQWLLADPGWSLSEPIMEMDGLFGPSGAGYFSLSFVWPLPRAVEAVVGYPREGTPMLWWLVGVAVGAAMGVKTWRSSPLWAVTLALILLVYPHACLVWHGDAMEVTRHALQAKIEFQIGLWLLGLLALDHMRADQTPTTVRRDPA